MSDYLYTVGFVSSFYQISLGLFENDPKNFKIAAHFMKNKQTKNKKQTQKQKITGESLTNCISEKVVPISTSNVLRFFHYIFLEICVYIYIYIYIYIYML